MAVAVRGDFSKLQALSKLTGDITVPAWRKRLAAVMGAEALKLVQMGFRSSVDPYGQRWAPLQHRKGKPLLDTGRLRNSFSYQAYPDGFEIGSGASYAKFHQYGTNGRRSASTQRRFVNAKGKFTTKEKAVSEGKVAMARSLRESFRTDRDQKRADKIQARLDRTLGKRAKRAKSKGRGTKRHGPMTRDARLKAAVGNTKNAMAATRLRKQLAEIKGRMASRAGKNVVRVRFINHKAGSGKVPRRMMVPEGTLGPGWAQALEASARRFVARELRQAKP